MVVFAHILQPLIDLNETILHFFHDDVGFGWGLSIICLTIAIRLAILPLTFKQVRSMQEMQRFSPEMQRIRERYKGDKTRQNEELMKLYKEHGFNPLGSCLPLLLQLPFFFSLYETLKSGGQTSKEIAASGDESFLFIPDLTAKLTDHPATLAVMVVLYVGSQLGSSYVSSLSVQDKNQRRLLFIFPFVFVPIVIQFPAGLLVYWITTNVFTVVQQLAVRKFLPAPEPHGGPKDDKDSKASRDGGGGDGPRPSRKRGPKPSSGGDGKAPTKTRAKAAGSNGKSDGGPAKPPPRSPRKKKKRTGRRR
jgi:YidC/Oxa1 family membrane protein insertase